MADEPLALAQVKLNLRLGSQTAEDELIKDLIVAARRMCERLTGQLIVGQWPTIEPADLPLVRQAMHVMIAAWYANRESGDVPPAASALLEGVRKVLL